MVNPFLLNAGTWDFHPLALAVPLAACALWALETRRYKTLLATCLLLMMCKEHFGLMVAGFGLLWGGRHREPLKSLGLTAFGILHFWLVIFVFMPHFSPTGEHVMLSSGLGQLSRYAWLGHSLNEIIPNLLSHPIRVLHEALFAMGGAEYLASLFLPFLFLPLLGGYALLLPILGDLCIALLSQNPMPREVFSYHSAVLIPFMCAAAIRGSQTLLNKWRLSSAIKISALVFIASSLFGYILSTLPLPLTHDFWAPAHLKLWPEPAIAQIDAMIEPHASVTAQANIGAHFSQREYIYSFPNGIGKASYIVLRLASPTRRIDPHDVGNIGTLANHLQMDPDQYLQTVSALLDGDRYAVVYWNDPWVVFKYRQADKVAGAAIRHRLEYLKRVWSN